MSSAQVVFYVEGCVLVEIEEKKMYQINWQYLGLVK